MADQSQPRPEPDPGKSSDIRIEFRNSADSSTTVVINHGNFSRHGKDYEEYLRAMDSDLPHPKAIIGMMTPARVSKPALSDLITHLLFKFRKLPIPRGKFTDENLARE